MSDDLDFEIIDVSDIIVSRSRKTKYTTKPWSYDDAKSEARYLLALASLHDRRGSDYGSELRNQVNQRLRYEIELESILPIYEYQGDDDVVCVIESDVHDVVIGDDLNAILNITLGDRFYVISAFKFDSVNNRIVCNVPSGIVYKKMDLVDVLDRVKSFIASDAFDRLSDSRKNLLFSWWPCADDYISLLKENDYV